MCLPETKNSDSDQYLPKRWPQRSGSSSNKHIASHRTGIGLKNRFRAGNRINPLYRAVGPAGRLPASVQGE
jgi:hypothetical protein